MKTQSLANRCVRCGSTKHLVIHHTSYIPEVTETVCRTCDAKDKRHPESRGFPILKVHPQRGWVLVHQNILAQFGSDLLEIELAPISPVGVLFQYNMPLEEVERSLQIVLQDIRLRMGKKEE